MHEQVEIAGENSRHWDPMGNGPSETEARKNQYA